MQVLSEAMYTARELAMTRMEEEADQLGADGIVGVRLDIGRYDVGRGHGGVHRHRHRDQAPRRRAAPRAQRPPVHERPVGPGLLDAAAHRPPPGRHGDGLVRLPRGAPRDVPVDASRPGQNIELPNFTQALYDARELAMERMQTEAEELKAEGIVGVQLKRGQPRLGQPRDRVLRGRHGDRALRRGADDRAADAGARPQLRVSPGARPM